MQVIVVPLLCGFTGRGVKPITWASAAVAFLGMGLLEGGGAQGESPTIHQSIGSLRTVAGPFRALQAHGQTAV